MVNVQEMFVQGLRSPAVQTETGSLPDVLPPQASQLLRTVSNKVKSATMVVVSLLLLQRLPGLPLHQSSLFRLKIAAFPMQNAFAELTIMANVIF